MRRVGPNNKDGGYVTVSDLLAMWQTVEQSEYGDAPQKAQVVFGPGTPSHQQDKEPHLRTHVTHHLNDRQSFLAYPNICQRVLARALALIPDEVKSKPGDTKESLVNRISGTSWFDEQKPLKGGGQKGKKRVRLAATTYAQARRLSFSAVVTDVHMNSSGERVCTMYAYGRPNSRIRDEVVASPMPVEIGELCVHLFVSVRHLLSDVCAKSPPVHCQLLGYYGLFNSKMGRHKDDHHLRTLWSVLLEDTTVEEAVKTTKGALVPGSDVLVFSTGPLHMLFSWCYTDAIYGPYAPRKWHKTHPFLQITLDHGSLLIFKSIDDLYFYHELSIKWTLENGQPSTCKETDYRFAFVFRWLGADKLREFPCSSD